jgi:ABC-2 type transport system permease protein
MGVVQNAYLNSASSLFVMKLQGTIVDLLVSPMAYGEILAGFVGAAVLRGLLVGGVTWLVAGLFTGFEVAHPALALAMLVLVAVVFAGMGVASAIWAQSFEQVNFFPTFFILPLTFLGGVFYSARDLPPALEPFTRANPVFYMVDAVRHGMLGISDAPPALGAGLVVSLAVVALAGPFLLLRSGWRLRG